LYWTSKVEHLVTFEAILSNTFTAHAQKRLFMNYTRLLHSFNGPLSRTTWVGWYQKGKTNLDFTEAWDSEWQWHQLGHMQVCTSLQTDNHVSTPPLSFLQAVCPSCRPTNSVKALKGWTIYELAVKFLTSSFDFSPPIFLQSAKFWRFGNVFHWFFNILYAECPPYFYFRFVWPTDLESVPYALTPTAIIPTKFEVDMLIHCWVKSVLCLVIR